jgi:sterol desaturase/sphingolipid hydroxylase (fatty acid hydroxylase superfamily)
MIRYFILSGFFHSYFYLWKKKNGNFAKSCKRPILQNSFKEITWSTLTTILFSVIGAFTAVLWQKGYTQLYTDLHWYDGWFPSDIVISMLIHETYYYWVHRWMHHPKIYHLVQKSIMTANYLRLDSLSFHPIEGLLEALIMPVIICIIPMHIYAATVHLTIMTITAAINHLDIEIYPKTKWGNWLGKDNDWSYSPQSSS